MITPSEAHKRRGVALFLVVCVLSIMVVVGYAFALYAGVNKQAARNAREQLVRRFALESALNYGLTLLRADARENDHDSLEEPWASEPKTVQVGKVACTIYIVDQNRKLNANRAARITAEPEEEPDLRPALKRILQAIEVAPDRTRAVTQWIRARGPLLGIKALSHMSAVGNLRTSDSESSKDISVEEVLCTHPEFVNINTVRPQVLQAILNDPETVSQLLSRRQGDPFTDRDEIQSFFETSHLPEEARNKVLMFGVKSTYFQLHIRCGAGRNLTALVHRDDEKTHVLKVRYGQREKRP